MKGTDDIMNKKGEKIILHKLIPNTKVTRALLLLAMMMLITTVTIGSVFAEEGTVTTVWTDKPDYSPEETVIIYGSGFYPLANVIVTVERPDGVIDTVSPNPLVNEDGTFSCEYLLDGITGLYLVTATDGTNTAMTIFTDTTYGVTFYTNPTTGTITVDENPGGISTKNDGDFINFNPGKTYDVTANPPTGYIFLNWAVTGGVGVGSSTSKTTSLTASTDGTLTANFQLSDTTRPTVTIGVSDTLISDADTGAGKFTVTATFSEAMDTAYTPTISFSPSVSTTLTNPSGAWNPGDTVYTVTYDVVDAGVEVAGVDVSVGGGKDVAGNSQDPDPTTASDKFDIDTKNPTVTITYPANGQYLYNDAFPIDIEGTASDALSGISSVQVKIDGGTWQDAIYDSVTDTWSFEWSGPVSDGSHTITAKATDGAGNVATTSVVVVVLSHSQVTTSSLCPFDRDSSTPGQEFNLLFTNDPTDIGKYRVTASNPGQFYYNVFYIGEPGETVDIALVIPSPFGTQGAVPIHVYSGVDVSSSGCFSPANEILQVALEFGKGGTIPIEDITVPDSGLVYVTIHLDFNWKKQTGYIIGTDNLADNTNDVYDLENLKKFVFSYKVNNVEQPDSPEIYNINIFKNDPGFFGIVTVDEEPVSGATITIKDSSGKVIGTAITDENGYWFFYYKHTGKAATFTVTLTSSITGTYSQIVTLKSNKFVWTPFEL